MAEKKAPPRSAAAQRMGRKAKQRENAFRDLQGLVDQIIKISPEVDKRLDRAIQRLEKRLDPKRKRPTPRLPKPPKERGA